MLSSHTERFIFIDIVYCTEEFTTFMEGVVKLTTLSDHLKAREAYQRAAERLKQEGNRASHFGAGFNRGLLSEI